MNKLTNTNEFFNNSFESAYNMCQTEFSHENLTEMLKNGSIAEKQIAAIKFDSINNKDDALALLNNLTGCDGKIREAVALRINLFLNEIPSTRKIFADIAGNTFADATIDINANICRLIVDSSAMLKDYSNFSSQYTQKIIKYTHEALNELDKFIFRDKKYVINKQIFKLYWCLEALSTYYDNISYDTLHEILNKCVLQKEYTIREKVAEIIIKTNNFSDIKEKLINDDNYYVKQILYH